MTRTLHFGAKDLVAAVGRRLDRSLRGTDSLVVGLFGEWGSGKTTVLRALERHFAERAEHTSEDSRALTLPVFFNAWRYEAEDHLIIPLLKTAERAVVDWHDAREGDGEKVWGWLRRRGRMLGQSVIALSYGFKGKLAIPGGPGIEFDPGKAIEEEKKRWEELEAGERSPIEKLESRYYDFHSHMQQLTGSAGDDTERLNLVFLIDDLDRCLPEKAVQMLESIKLFLEVEGCAFVVAVDDEVVARGIAHRYRDYAVGHQRTYDSIAHSLHPERFKRYQELRGPLPQQPITGNEYLEKIVHLPVRLPQPSEPAVREFLVARYPALFGRREPDDDRSGDADADGLPEVRKATKARGGEGGTDHRRQLQDLFVRCVPPVPRKLVRAAELFEMLRGLAHDRGWTDVHEPTLARLVFLQLFAPALYRFGRRQPAFLATLEQWAESPMWTTGDHVEQDVEERLKAAWEIEDDEERRSAVLPLEERERPLLVLVRDALRNRSGFDPRKLVGHGPPCDDGLRRYFELLDTEPPAEGERGATLATELEPARLEDPEVFLVQLISRDPLAWRNALEQEGDRLAGRRLDDETFATLLGIVRKRPEIVGLEWIGTLNPHLAPQQMIDLYRESDLLNRLAPQEDS